MLPVRCCTGFVMVVHIGVVNSRYTVACLLEIGLLVAGCSSNAGSSAPTTTPVPAHAATPAAEPATAGAPAVPPAGKVVARSATHLKASSSESRESGRSPCGTPTASS